MHVTAPILKPTCDQKPEIFFAGPYGHRIESLLQCMPVISQNVLERREVATKPCVQTSSFLFVGMWRICKSSKIKHPGGSGGFVV